MRKGAKWICRALVGLVAYISFFGFQHGRALEKGRDFSKGLRGKVIQVEALPQPVSPFRWALYGETEGRVFQGFVDLRKKEISEPAGRNNSIVLRLDRFCDPSEGISFQSIEKLLPFPWVKKALTTQGVEFYFWFTRFPVVQSIHSKDGRHRVEFMGVRFYLLGIHFSSSTSSSLMIQVRSDQRDF